MLSALLGDGADLGAAEAHDHRAHRGQSVLHGRDGAGAVRRGRAGAQRLAVRLTKALAELKIPPTVQAILAARIDRLPPAEKDLLQTLAVIGNEFPLSLVRAVVGNPTTSLNRMLDNLQLASSSTSSPRSAISSTPSSTRSPRRWHTSRC